MQIDFTGDYDILDSDPQAPTSTFDTPGPSSSPMPAKSLPCPQRNVAGQRSANNPFQIDASPGLMPGGVHPHQDLPKSWPWAVDFHHLQNFEPAVAFESHCTRHCASPLMSDTASRFRSRSHRFGQLASQDQRAPDGRPSSLLPGNGISTRKVGMDSGTGGWLSTSASQTLLIRRFGERRKAPD